MWFKLSGTNTQFMLSVITLSVITLSVITLNVVAPSMFMRKLDWQVAYIRYIDADENTGIDYQSKISFFAQKTFFCKKMKKILICFYTSRKKVSERMTNLVKSKHIFKIVNETRRRANKIFTVLGGL
jgi:hypothetical protein